MAVHLLIDGYNFLKRSGLSAVLGPSDLEGARRYLLDRLSEYRKGKQIRIAVVFDATQGLSLQRQREGFRGIDVIYSRQGETADEVMVEVIRRKPPGLVVVTSDRAIIDEAKKHGVTFMTPDRLEMAIDGGTDEDRSERTEKKGNPRKAPKGLRRARRMIKKV